MYKKWILLLVVLIAAYFLSVWLKQRTEQPHANLPRAGCEQTTEEDLMTILLSPDSEIVRLDGKVFICPKQVDQDDNEDMQPVKLYYYNEARDRELSGSESLSCSSEAVLPVERNIAATEDAIKSTLEQLFLGSLSQQEREDGFNTEFPNDQFRLISHELENGILTLEFTEVPGFTSGGACRIGILRAQIEKTALQFPEVTTVRFLPEEIFQP